MFFLHWSNSFIFGEPHVTHVISNAFPFSNVCSIQVCLLGIIDNLIAVKRERTLENVFCSRLENYLHIKRPDLFINSTSLYLEMYHTTGLNAVHLHTFIGVYILHFYFTCLSDRVGGVKTPIRLLFSVYALLKRIPFTSFSEDTTGS